MRGGSNGQGNFTFMQAIALRAGPCPSLVLALVLVLQQATAMKEDPLDSREVARQGSPQREGGPLDMDVWGVIGTRNTNVPSRLPVPARIGVTSCTLHQPHATVLSHLIQRPSFLPYIIWPGQDTLLTCQFHSLSEVEKKDTLKYIHSFSFDFIPVRRGLVWSVLPLPRACPSPR